VQELVTQLPLLSGLIEKGGIVGVMLIVIAFLIYDRMRLVKRLEKTFAERDLARAIQIRQKSMIDGAGLKVDLTDIYEMFKQQPT
jgi:hypothetical protein